MLGELIAGRFQVEKLLGAGGMSSVYLARDLELERRVAVKVLHEQHGRDTQFVERFRREARVMARLSHPNIVTVIDRGEHEGREYIVFEHVDSETLKELLEREGPLAVEAAVTIAHAVAQGLAFAHRHGVVHRDIKPHNVLVSAGGIKVSDFGIARALDSRESLTEAGTVLGTSGYVSPEQASGSEVDARSDQYSLGVLLFELLAGELPFQGRSLAEVVRGHLREPVPSVRERRADVAPELDALVQRALAKHPRERFGSMDELAKALEAVGGSSTVAPPTPPRRRPATPKRAVRTSELLLYGGLALAVAAVVAGVLGLRDGAGDEESRAGKEPATLVELRALADFDPEGDGAEHPEDVPAATDGDLGTYWTTEGYSAFQKSGVGLVFDASESTDLARLVVRSDTPGFRAEIRASQRPDGGFTRLANVRTVGRRTAFELQGEERFRYYLLWITDPNGRAHVNEVTAS